MRILWGTAPGKESWAEDIITTNEDRIEDAKKWACKNGFTNLRISELIDGEPPDFIGTINH